jgi:hypothetical protein
MRCWLIQGASRSIMLSWILTRHSIGWQHPLWYKSVFLTMCALQSIHCDTSLCLLQCPPCKISTAIQVCVCYSVHLAKYPLWYKTLFVTVSTLQSIHCDTSLCLSQSPPCKASTVTQVCVCYSVHPAKYPLWHKSVFVTVSSLQSIHCDTSLCLLQCPPCKVSTVIQVCVCYSVHPAKHSRRNSSRPTAKFGREAVISKWYSSALTGRQT